MSAHSFRLVPAAYLLLVRDRAGLPPEVLLQLRRNTGYMDGHWAAGIAGHVEPGESVYHTCVREAAEEMGIEVAAADLVPVTAMHRTQDLGGDPQEQRIDMFFVLRRWKGEPSIQEPAKSAAQGWFALDALPEPIPPHERVVLTLLGEELSGGASVPAVLAHGFPPGS